MRLVIGLMLALLATPAMAQLVTTPSEVMRAAVNNVIRPEMARFQTQAQGLSTAIEALCTTPSAEALTAAGAAFGQTATAFGRIEAIRVGPMMEENRSDRLLFFPDRKGIALRQVQAILADEDASAADPATLKDKSVAVQGLGALEFVLYGTGFEALQGQEGAFRCRYGLAIAQNVAGLAGELVDGWAAEDGIALHLMKPNETYADYRTGTEAMEELAGILAHGIEAVRDTRINPFLAKDGKAANPKLALFWRSGQTMAMVRANVEGLERLFRLSGVGTAVNPESAGLQGLIEAEFGKAEAALDRVTAPVEAAVEDPTQVAALGEGVSATQGLQTLIGEQLSAAMGLSVGFSSLDGD